MNHFRVFRGVILKYRLVDAPPEQFANHLITEQKLISGQSDDGNVSECVLLVQLRRWNFILIDSYLASFVMQTDASKRGLPMIVALRRHAGRLSERLKML